MDTVQHLKVWLNESISDIEQSLIDGGEFYAQELLRERRLVFKQVTQVIDIFEKKNPLIKQRV